MPPPPRAAPDPGTRGVPDVTVVVIAYNDRARLPEAVASVTRQTLRNLEVVVVDDCSTDGTADVAQTLADGDDRIRVLRLPENSGGCSRPRNAGIEHARAPYVMFLDSDDVLERHACKNLLLAAERTGAEVVGGEVVQVMTALGEEKLWFPDLFADRAVYAGIRDNPALFFDALSTNKIYRRAFLDAHDIRFPEGVHYEDSLFTTKVYCLASAVALIPNVVYYWHVRHEPEHSSITQRRFELDNFRSRIAVQQMMDAFLVEHGAADLVAHKNFKFVRHDLRLYLNDLPRRDEDYQRQFVSLAADYLATVDAETLAMLKPVERICVHLILQHDVEGTLRTVDYLRHDYLLSTPLVARDGRIYWSGDHLETAEGRAVMDVTDMGLHRVPFERQSVFNELREVSRRGSRIRLAGRVLNQLGQIAPGDELRMHVVVTNRARRTPRRVPVTAVAHRGQYLEYVADLDLRRACAPLDQPLPTWDVQLEITWAGRTNLAPFVLDPRLVEGWRIPVRGRLGGAVAGVLAPTVTAKRVLELAQVPETGAARAAAADVLVQVQRVRNGLPGRVRRLLADPRVVRRAYRAFARLPVRRGLTVFESHLGLQYSDSPKYVFEQARLEGFDRLGLTPVWSYATPTDDGFPRDVTRVRRLSLRYVYLMARAQFWVDNQGFPRALDKRPETTYLQTWHGTPLKTMGWDEPSLAALSPRARAAHERGVARWDYLVAPSEYFVETFARAYRYDGKLLRVGYPRNDPLVAAAGDPEKLRSAKRRLGLPLDRPVVLYAPTFRDTGRGPRPRYRLPLDLKELGASLGDRIFLLIRTHYLDRYWLSREFAPFAMNVSDHHDVTELLLATDVLVTDYSSTMFDFANTGRPMVFYTYDYDDYVSAERGTYFSLAAEAPGPLVRTTAELVDALSDLDRLAADHAEGLRRWKSRFGQYETGHASGDVVDAVFGSRGRS